MRSIHHMFRLASYIFLGRTHTVYHSAKMVYRFAFKRGNLYRLPNYSSTAVMVEGFVHSGNSFVRGNIHPGFLSDTPGFHRSWAVRRALQNNVPTILLIRAPLEVALSIHYRSLRHSDGPVPLAIALACWLAYYRSVWKFRHQVLLVSLDELIGNYSVTSKRIEQFASITMNAIPDDAYKGSYDGERPPIEMSKLNDFLLRRCQAMYARYIAFGNSQARHLG